MHPVSRFLYCYSFFLCACYSLLLLLEEKKLFQKVEKMNIYQLLPHILLKQLLRLELKIRVDSGFEIE